MAKATFKMPDEFLMKVSKLADRTDEILPKVLEAGAEVIEGKVRSNLSSIIGKGTKEPSRSTGQLLSALGTSPALQDKNGDFNVKVGFAEPRSDGESNAKNSTGRHLKRRMSNVFLQLLLQNFSAQLEWVFQQDTV